MRLVRTLAAVAAVAIAGLVGAPAARAQAGTPVIAYKTVGGFTMYNVDLKLYSTGFAVASMVRHDGTTLIMTDYLTAAQVRSVAHALDSAGWATMATTVRTRNMIADAPNHVVTYKGKTVTYQTFGAGSSAPVAGASFVAVVGRLGGLFSTIGDKPEFSLDVTGGIAGFNNHLVVKRNGDASYDTNGGHKDGWFEVATMNDLKRKAGRWSTLRKDYPATATVSDAMFYAVGVYDEHDKLKTVTWQTSSRPSATATNLEQALEAAAVAIP
ncbi:MAG TPA: hypothetical protein VHF22_05940 [Planctomycetota bacterium]|nr:hypothetical protein [Planctomycetota bacterium]